MRQTKTADLWVVYQMTVHKKHVPVNAVCEQGEWDEMERLRPGQPLSVRPAGGAAAAASAPAR